jgi:UDPglucose 6-dehydrogenase
MASLGHEVIVLDVDAAKLDLLAAGKVPFYEPGLEELLTEGIASGRLHFTKDFAEVANFAQLHFLCVGTPQRADSGAADLSQVSGAISSLAPHLVRDAIVIGKSTVPVGTAASLQLQIAQHNSSANLVWNPEFLREGFAVEDTLRPDRIVLGAADESAAAQVAHVYQVALDAGTPLIVTGFETAELVKVAANAFLATKISFINAFADLCDATGADVKVLADAIGHDTRIGRRFLNAGVGFGGGCLPKDIRALGARAEELGLATQFGFLDELDAINLSRRTLVVQKAQLALGEVAGKKVAILGAAFKPDSDDIRDSPALDVANALHALGANVQIHDPAALPVVQRVYPELQVEEQLNEVLRDADIVIHLTEWQEYRLLDPEQVGALVAKRQLIDGRNVLDLESWAGAGWKVEYLGRPGN